MCAGHHSSPDGIFFGICFRFFSRFPVHTKSDRVSPARMSPGSALGDRSYGASTCAGAAADAHILINCELSAIVRNSAHRASTSTSTTANACITNYICHSVFPPSVKCVLRCIPILHHSGRINKENYYTERSDSKRLRSTGSATIYALISRMLSASSFIERRI